MFSVKTVQIFEGQKKKKKKKKNFSTNALNLHEYIRSNKLITLF